MAPIKIEFDSDVFFYIQLKSKVEVTKFPIYVDVVEINMRSELEDKNYAPPAIGSLNNSKDFFAQFEVVGVAEQ